VQFRFHTKVSKYKKEENKHEFHVQDIQKEGQAIRITLNFETLLHSLY